MLLVFAAAVNSHVCALSRRIERYIIPARILRARPSLQCTTNGWPECFSSKSLSAIVMLAYQLCACSQKDDQARCSCVTTPGSPDFALSSETSDFAPAL